MPVQLEDMSLRRNALPLSGVGPGLQALINNIINESNETNILWGAGKAGKQAFFNHHYDRDPSTNGGSLANHVKVAIYYQPSTKREYDAYEVVDKEVGMLSGRRRLAVRIANGRYSFYITNHPRERPGLRTNVYGVFTPIDPSK